VPHRLQVGDYLLANFISASVVWEQRAITFKFAVMLLAESTGVSADAACEVSCVVHLNHTINSLRMLLETFQALSLGMTYQQLLSARAIHPTVYRFAVIGDGFEKGGRAPAQFSAHRALVDAQPDHEASMALAKFLQHINPAFVETKDFDIDGVKKKLLVVKQSTFT
jgi:hypothetical protein